MNNDTITRLKNSFDVITQIENKSGVEFWFARDLMEKLGYTKWQNFQEVIKKSKISCQNAGGEIKNHFTDVSKMVDIGSGISRPIDDIMLTRYACYLIAQNGDPRKEEIAFAQTYFAVQTRKQEIIEERIRLNERLSARQKLSESETELSRNIYERGVDEKGFGRIRSKGDSALFGGHNTQIMKTKLSVPENRPLADFLPTVTIAAKNLATEMTNHNVKHKDLYGEPSITDEHVQNNTSVRKILGERGIKPEELPPAEDLKKLERKVKSSDKKLVKDCGLPTEPEDGE